jgi:hypothetical protein
MKNATTRRRLLQNTAWAAGAAAFVGANARAQTAAASEQPPCLRFFPSGPGLYASDSPG